MQITAIHIENFKGIREKVTIPLKSINLLFGGNSAGKSTILKALLYFRESLETLGSNVDLVQGERISLGGFETCCNHVELAKGYKAKFSIGLEFSLLDEGLTDEDDMIAFALKGLPQVGGNTVGFTFVFGSHSLELVIKYNKKLLVRLDCTSCTTVLEASSTLPFKMPDSELGEEGSVLKFFSNQEEGNWFDDLGEPENYLYTDEQGKFSCGMNLTKRSGLEFIPLNKTRGSDFIGVKWGDEGVYAPVETIGDVLASAILGPYHLLRNHLSRIRYIGPFREIPPRNFGASLSYREARKLTWSSWADGLAAWATFLTWSDSDPEDVEELEELNAAVEQLGMGYQVSIDRELSLPRKSELTSLLEREAGGISAFQDVNPSKIEKMLKDLKVRDKIELIDTETGASVSPQDVGVGVSQVIPVAIGAVDGGASIFAVEQPELHIHPAVQCRLADVIIRASKKFPERIFLFETHSEHMILRLLRRIRETSAGSVNLDGQELTTDQLGVLHVAKDAVGVEITELQITDDGDFEEDWPDGFFDDRSEELF